MSRISTVTVRFARRVVPVQYEHAEADITAVIVADDDETVSEDGISTTLAMVRGKVNAALGKGPAKAPETAALAPDTAITAETTAEPAAAAEEAPAKPKRTRRTKAQIAADKAEEATKAPNDEDPAVMSAAEEISDADLVKFAAEAAKKHTAPKVKEVMVKFEIARLGELEGSKRAAFIAELRAL